MAVIRSLMWILLFKLKQRASICSLFPSPFFRLLKSTHTELSEFHLNSTHHDTYIHTLYMHTPTHYIQGCVLAIFKLLSSSLLASSTETWTPFQQSSIYPSTKFSPFSTRFVLFLRLSHFLILSLQLHYFSCCTPSLTINISVLT